MANKRFGFRDQKSKWRGRIENPAGWIEILRQNMKPGQINPHIALIALKDHLATFLSDAWGELRRQTSSTEADSPASKQNNGLYLNNTEAFAEVYAKNYLPAHASNIAISMTENVYGTLDPSDVRRGLGTTGEVTDYKAFVNISTKYKDEIEVVKAKAETLASTPILINDDNMLLIYEDAYFRSSKDRFHISYGIMRPEVFARLKYRFANNNTAFITEALSQILTYDELQVRLSNIFEPSATVIATYTIEDKIQSFSKEVEESMDKDGYVQSASEGPVDKKDCYYVNNPAILAQLMDYRQQNEESHVRIDFVPLSRFNLLKGNDKVEYLSEAYKVATHKADPVTEETADGALNKKQLDIVNLLIDNKIDSTNDKYIDIIAPNSVYSEELIHLDDKGHSARSLNIISNSRNEATYDEDEGNVSGVDMELGGKKSVHTYSIWSMDTKFMKSSGYKNSGYLATCDISVKDTLSQLKAYIGSIFTASNSSSAVLSFTSKLVDINNSRNGYTLDIQAADFYGLTNHMIEAVKVDLMKIANNKNHFVLTAGTKIKKTNILTATPDINVTSKTIESFNKSKSISVKSNYTMKAREIIYDATRLSNGIAYVSMNPSNHMISATVLDKVILPVDNTPIRKSDTASSTNFSLGMTSSSNTTLIEDYFDGRAFSDSSGNLNIEYKDMLQGVNFYPHLSGVETIKKMIETKTEVLENSFTKYEVIEVIEDSWITMNDEVKSDRKTFIYSIVPSGYKQSASVTGLEMMFRLWREVIMAKQLFVETKERNKSRTIIKEPSDIYEISKALKSNTLMSVDHHQYSGFISKEEQITLTTQKIVGNYIKVSDNFEEIFEEIAKAIKSNLNNEYDGKLDVIDNLRNVTGAINTFQMSLRKSVVEAIKGYSLIERLFILKALFN